MHGRQVGRWLLNSKTESSLRCIVVKATWQIKCDYTKFIDEQRWRSGGRPCLEDVLKDTFWSPWPWPRRSSPWPRPRSLKPSKIALSSARGQHYFLNRLIILENARNLAENLKRPFLFSSFGDRLKKRFWRLFFPIFGNRLKKSFEYFFFIWRTLASVSLVLGLGRERVCPRKSYSWPYSRIFFVSLASSFVFSTSLQLMRTSIC